VVDGLSGRIAGIEDQRRTNRMTKGVWIGYLQEGARIRVIWRSGSPGLEALKGIVGD
jgi:hypothetical protein